MYSLYRAWFGDENYSHLETLSPPDTVIRVGNEGEHQFVAHRGVLATHSGYLKALLSTSVSTESAAITADSQRVTSISVPSVGGEAFAPLLNYMYTGHLDVTVDNIYSVLLATHLLHMPGALEQCRAALLRLRSPPSAPIAPPVPPPPPIAPPPQSFSTSPSRFTTTTLYRPVPNRLVGSPLCWPQSSLYSPTPVAFSHLNNLPLSPAIPSLQSSRIIHETTATTSFSSRINSPGISLTNYVLGKPQKNHSISSTKTTKSKSKEEKEETTLKISDRDVDELISEQSQRSIISQHISNSLDDSEKNSILNIETLSQRKSNGRNSRSSIKNNSTINSNGVVLDVACCDGPVTFHRVLNENYKVASTEHETPSRLKTSQVCASSSRDEENIGENDENGRPDKSENEDSNGNSNGSGGNYTCEYCRHTFKSHYCYKKHAKRHLLPTSSDENIIGRNEERRREVRLLDLNVQYYPCKICGSKFPSYYFVHKHKKLCHSSVDERNTEVESNQIVEVTASSSKS